MRESYHSSVIGRSFHTGSLRSVDLREIPQAVIARLDARVTAMAALPEKQH